MTLKSAGLSDFTAQIQSIVTTGTSLKPYFDRNPLDQPQVYSIRAIAPHSVSIRWSYTVPANRKAFTSSAVATQLRDATSGTPSYSTAWIEFNGNIVCVATMINGALSASASSNLAGSILGLAGDVIRGKTEDLSIGGTVYYVVSAIITEYDA